MNAVKTDIRLAWCVRGAVALVLVDFLVNWLGWATGIEPLKRILRDWPHLTPWTAALLATLATSILLQAGHATRARVWTARALTALTGAAAGLFLAEYQTGRSFGLDKMLFTDAVSELQQTWPGRPSPLTVLSAFLVAAAIALAKLEYRWIRLVWPLCLVAAMAPAAVTGIGYLHDAHSIKGLSQSMGMAHATALAVLLLVAATALSRPDLNPLAWLLARPDRRTLLRLAGIIAGFPAAIAVWRLVLSPLTLEDDAEWVLSITMGTLMLGVATLFTSQRTQRLLIDKELLATQRAQAEHQRAEAERQRAEAVERYRILADNAVDVVLHLRGREPVWVSPSIEAALGWAPNQWIGADLLAHVHPADVEVASAALAANTQGGTVIARGRLAAADGGYHWAEGRGKRYIDAQGNNDGVIVSLRIIDAQVAMEQELQRARDSAVALTEAKSEYVATVSHEIRAPLHAIHGFAELLENQLSAEGRPETAEWSTRVRAEAQRLTRLIEDLLDLSRLEAGKTKIDSKSFQLRRMVDDVIQIARIKADAKGIQLDSSIDPAIADWRSGDPDRLHQVLMNLVSNATKFTREGFIDVEISPVESSAVKGSVRFAVTDTGPGIPAEEIDRILQPFAQVSVVDADRGSGLGLAISDKIVKTLGGEGLAVTSLEGHGSTFHFTVPLPESAPQQPDSKHQGEPNGAGSMKTILVVDDNPTNQLLASAQLKKLGYRCQVASDGAKALERIEADRFDAVLMDCNMPVMDGYEATRRIRAGERGTGQHITVLALTASAIGANRDACVRAGMDGFLTKPLRLSELAQELSHFLDSRGPGGLEAETGRDVPGKSGAPILDAARIDRLVAELGADPVRKVAHAFATEIPQRLVKLCSVAAQGDADAVRRGAHSIRSPSTMLGADALAERLAAVEESANPAATVSATQLGDLVNATLTQLRARIDQCAEHVGPQ